MLVLCLLSYVEENRAEDTSQLLRDYKVYVFKIKAISIAFIVRWVSFFLGHKIIIIIIIIVIIIINIYQCGVH